MTKLSKKFLSIILIIFVALFATNVYAECTAEEIAGLKREAQNVRAYILPHIEICYPGDPCHKEQMDYIKGLLRDSDSTISEKDLDEYVKDGLPYGITESGEEGFLPFLKEAFLEVSIYNITENLMVKIDHSRTTKWEYPREVHYKDMNGSNKYSFEWRDSYELGKFTIKVYASSNTSCPNQALNVITLNQPKLNEYYQYELCKDLEDYYLCQPFINVNLDNYSATSFIQAIENEKKQREDNKKEEEKSKNNNKNTYMYVFAGTAVGMGLIVLGTILIKKKRR